MIYLVWVRWSNGKTEVCHRYTDIEQAKKHAQWHRDTGRASSVERAKVEKSAEGSNA